MSSLIPSLIRSAYEYNVPILALETEYLHDPFSFLAVDPPSVLITAIKEIEPNLPDAPDWCHNPSMGELAYIVRCVELEGCSQSVTLRLNPKINLKAVQEVDLLERIRENGIESQSVTFEGQQIKFPIKPYEIKSILLCARIPLEDPPK